MGVTETLKMIVTADTAAASSAFKKLGADAESGLGKAQQGSSKLGGAMSSLNSVISANTIPIIGGLAAGAVKLAFTWENSAIAAGKFATATGLSTEKASALMNVSDDLGVSTDTLATLMNRMLKTAGTTPKVFNDLGVAIAHTASGAVDSNKTFENTIDHLAAIQDPTQRAAEGTKLLGKSWADATPLIDAGSASLREMEASTPKNLIFHPEDVSTAKDMKASFKDLGDAVENLGMAVGKTLVPLLTDIAKAATTVVGAGEDISAGLDKVKAPHTDDWISAKTALLTFATAGLYPVGKGAKELFDVMTEGKKPIADFGDAVVRTGPVMNAIAAANEKAAKSVQNYTSANEQAYDASDEMAIAKAKETLAIDAAKKATDDAKAAADAFWQTQQNIADNKKALDDAELARTQAQADAEKAAQQATEDAAAALQRVEEADKQATDDLSKSLDHVADKFDDAASSADSMRSAIDKVTQATLGTEDANAAYEQSIDDLAESFKKNGRSIDIGTEKGRNNRKAVEDVTKAIYDQITADVGAGKSTTDAAKAAELRTAALEKQLIKQGLTKASADALIKTMGLTPKDIETAVNLSNDEQTKKKLQDQIALLGVIDAGAAAKIQADLDKGPGSGFAAAQKDIDDLVKTRQVTVAIQAIINEAIIGGANPGNGGLPSAAPAPAAAPAAPGSTIVSGGTKKPIQTTGPGQADGGTNVPGDVKRVLEGGQSELLEENGQFFLMSGSRNRVVPIQNVTHTSTPAAASASPVAVAGSGASTGVDDAIKEQDRLQAAMYKTGRESLADYRAYVAGRQAAAKDLSDDWLAQYDILQGLADTEKSQNDAKLKSDEDATQATADMLAKQAQASADAIQKIYTDAQNARDSALAQAQQHSDVDAVNAAQGQVNANKRGTAANKAAAAKDLADAQTKLADDAYKAALAQAAAAGLDTGTVEWDRMVRAILTSDITGYSTLPGTVSSLQGYLTGIPALAKGGIIPATPGGRLVRAGEAGQDEAIVPLDGRFGGDNYVTHIHVELKAGARITPAEADIIANAVEEANRRNGRGRRAA